MRSSLTSAPPVIKPSMLRKEVHRELTENILPYWMNNTIDDEHGGFYGRITNSGEIVRQAPKGLILNTRILWTFSAAFAAFKDNAYLKMAERAYHYIITNFIDEEFGGAFWMLDCHGFPVEDKKKIYGHAFLIYALAEYYGITQNKTALNQAVTIFELLETHSHDKEQGGYFEAALRDWSLTDDLRLSESDMNEKKSMNSHLHILEAYTNLFRHWQDPSLKNQLLKLIQHFRQHITDPVSYHYRLFFDENWEPKSHSISLGHDIEGSWLITEAAEVLADPTLLVEVSEFALKQAQAVFEKGLSVEGALNYEIRSDGYIDTEKIWWTQAEAMVGFLNAFELSQNPEYYEVITRIWKYIQDFLVDKQYGEWFYKRKSNGQIAENMHKVSEWKGPYHNGRACLEIIRRLDKWDTSWLIL